MALRAAFARFSALALAGALLAAGPGAAQDAAQHTAQGAARADAPQLIADLRILAGDAMEGRRAGTPGGAKARAYIIERLEAIGAAPLGERYAAPFTFETRPDFRDRGAEPVRREAVNVFAVVPGVEATPGGPVLVASAHYDHVGVIDGEIYNGADDNASGVAALLALAEALQAEPPRHDVILAFFDAEEGGLNGARAFIADPPLDAARIAANLNLDMLGYSPDGDLWAAGGYHTPALRPLLDAAAEASPVILKQGYDQPTGDPREDWTLLSDHGPFHLAGVPFVYLGVEDHEHYHQPSDEFATIPQDFFLGAAATAIDVARRLDAALPALHAARLERLDAAEGEAAPAD